MVQGREPKWSAGNPTAPGYVCSINPSSFFLPIDSATSGNREDMAGHSAIVERLPPPDDAFVAGAVSAAAQRVGRELLMTLIPATHKGRT
jgi:hypothetical protein